MSKRTWIIFGVLAAVAMTLDWVFGNGVSACQATVLSGTLGAVLGADTAKDQNKENQRQANVNAVMALLSRGMPVDAKTLMRIGLPRALANTLSNRASAVLPYYLQGAEQNLGLGAAGASQLIQSLGGGAQGQADDIQRILEQAGEGDSANMMFANDIASGREGQRMLDENAPVQEARMGVATGKRSAALESLKQTLNDIDAIQSKKGFQGDSVGGRMLAFNARKNIGVSSAADIGGARLQNASDTAAIQSAGRGLRLQNVNLGDTLARNQAGRTNLAGKTIADRFQASFAPLSFLNMGPHDFRNYDSNQQAIPGGAELALRGANATGSSLLNYYLQQQARNTKPNQTTPPPNSSSGDANTAGAASGGGGGGGGGYSMWDGSDWGA